MKHCKIQFGDTVRAIYGNSVDSDDTALNCWIYRTDLPDVLIGFAPLIKQKAVHSPLLKIIFGVENEFRNDTK